MLQYAEYCGWALARAHARAGKPALIAGDLGKGDQFDEAVADSILAYYRLVCIVKGIKPYGWIRSRNFLTESGPKTKK